MSAALFYYQNPAATGHILPEGHPESAARMGAVAAARAALPAHLRVEDQPCPVAEPAVLTLAHSPAHLAALEAAVPAAGLAALDGDTFVSPGSWQAALQGAGAALAATEAVLKGRARRAFVATRPPGHHAEADRAMGFCLLNNVALAAKAALEMHGCAKVAIVDFDVHHGNGTQDIFWEDPRALFISSHQWPLYPGTGAAAETGLAGNILNLPLPPGSDGAFMRRVYTEKALPALRAFGPEILFLSAGFDAHAADPLGGLRWAAADFAWVTRALCAAVSGPAKGRVVSALEGGYDLAALQASALAHLGALAEQDE